MPIIHFWVPYLLCAPRQPPGATIIRSARRAAARAPRALEGWVKMCQANGRAGLRLMLAVGAAVSPAMIVVQAWDNGVALTPVRGWQNWNAFHNDFNASLAIEVAHFLKDSGLLAAGFDYLTLGGMAYAEHGDPQSVPGFPNIPQQNITRNATGHLQVDAARFPGPGSSPSCLAGGPDLQTCLQKHNYSSPEACGCVNGN